MKDTLPDKTIILIILCTILLVFSFIFLFKPTNYQIEPSIQWKDSSMTNMQEINS